MSTIHFKLTTTATPEQFIAGLTDFGPGRARPVSGLDPERGTYRSGALFSDPDGNSWCSRKLPRASPAVFLPSVL